MKGILGLLFLVASGHAQSDEEIHEVTSTIWYADYLGRFDQNQLVYNIIPPGVFDYVDSDQQSVSTWPQFEALLDNYNPMTGVTDPSFDCSVCRTEENDFLDAVIDSAPMKEAWAFLRQRGLANITHDGFRDELWNLWFKHYQRDSPNDSSGFEHVFIGEIRTGRQPVEVTGFHNWWFAYSEEFRGNWDAVQHRGSGHNRCESWQFWWTVEGQQYWKNISSIMKGCSPEFELSIYTLCFLTRPGNRGCQIRLGGDDIMDVTTHPFNNNPIIGSAFIRCDS